MGGGLALARAASGFDIAAVHTGQLPKNLEATLTDARPLVGSYGARDRTARGAAAILEGAWRLASEVWRHTEEFFVPQLVNDRWATRTHRDLDDTCRRGPSVLRARRH